MPTTISKEITVTTPDGGDATGTLVVNTSTNPNSGTFTPDGGTETDVTPVTWSQNANGAVGFNFQVSEEENGDFPAGANGNQYNYRFTGTQNANGNPTGTVNWPGSDPEGDPDVTWQAGSTVGEPYAASKGAS